MRLAAATASNQPMPTGKTPPIFFTPDGRVDWVDVAKGICILFVVMMHSTLGVEADLGEPSWMGTIVAWAQPFRMPDFFFIAGLFLMKTIDAPWRRYIDRKIVHFAYFYLLWMVIQGVLKGGLLTGDPGAVPGVLLTALYEPYGTLWFIYMLPIFFLVTRLTKALPVWVMLAFGAALEIAPISTGYLLVDEFAARFVYFYAGYALAGYAFGLADRSSKRPLLALGFLGAWAIINTAAVFTSVEVLGEVRPISQLPILSLALGGLGALAVVITASLIVKSLVGRGFAYMGARSIVIYLAFFLPMVVVRELGIRFGLIPDAGLLSFLTTLVATVSPLIGYWIVQKVGFGRFFFERPRWASIDRGDRDGTPQRAAIAPAE
ncbi:MAG: acyltransferase family protein [Pseudomonadota bacterium]